MTELDRLDALLAERDRLAALTDPDRLDILNDRLWRALQAKQQATWADAAGVILPGGLCAWTNYDVLFIERCEPMPASSLTDNAEPVEPAPDPNIDGIASALELVSALEGLAARLARVDDDLRVCIGRLYHVRRDCPNTVFTVNHRYALGSTGDGYDKVILLVDPATLSLGGDS